MLCLIMLTLCLLTPDLYCFQHFDRLFDIMNSRSIRAKGFKQPLRNLDGVYGFLVDTRAYLLSLRMEDGLPLYRSHR